MALLHLCLAVLAGLTLSAIASLLGFSCVVDAVAHHLALLTPGSAGTRSPRPRRYSLLNSVSMLQRGGRLLTSRYEELGGVRGAVSDTSRRISAVRRFPMGPTRPPRRCRSLATPVASRHTPARWSQRYAGRGCRIGLTPSLYPAHVGDGRRGQGSLNRAGSDRSCASVTVCVGRGRTE
jgi:hypothetical protein